MSNLQTLTVVINNPDHVCYLTHFVQVKNRGGCNLVKTKNQTRVSSEYGSAFGWAIRKQMCVLIFKFKTKPNQND